jgi:hypothetical protein
MVVTNSSDCQAIVPVAEGEVRARELALDVLG